ncbi:MAG: class I SAM-dependent methyltransferase [Sphingomonadaceae bacterium]|nr:class I SAM-dependent methyltransferase [Sphingomonadaceae bacterium]
MPPYEPGSRDDALAALLHELKAVNYAFVTPTPATHARVVARPDRRVARDLRGALGWSLPFATGSIPPRTEELLHAAGALSEADGMWRSAIRVSSLRGDLYIHSAFPTDAANAVFFGPDSYRFADLIAAELRDVVGRPRIVDIGTGSGVGAIVASRCRPDSVVLATDINAEALRFAAINAKAAHVEIEFRHGRDLAGIEGPFDVVVANPPFMVDSSARAYRDGGGARGSQVSFNIAQAAIPALAAGGRLILYTGSPIVDSFDELADKLGTMSRLANVALQYREIDPDIFGEELDGQSYSSVDRIAAVAALFRVPVESMGSHIPR